MGYLLHQDLVHFGNQSKRTKNKEYNELNIQFSDGYPLLITTESSLSALNQLLDQAISMNRFRPNIVLSNTEALEENIWKSLQIGKNTIQIANACERCTVTSIDQTTGNKTPKEPLQSLIKLQGSPALFGMNAYPVNDFKISVGNKCSNSK